VIRTRQSLQALLAVLCVTAVAHAQGRKNPTSKLYVADTVGDVQIDTGEEVDELTKKSVFSASGAVIETKPSSNASIVLSNGTGLYFDIDTHVTIKAFEQEAFKPNRDNIEDEPSVSATRIFVDHGVIGVSTSKLAAGSTMLYETPLASASIRGRQAVILSQDNLTVISMVQGEATVQAGPLGRSYLVKNRQQIIIKPGKKDEENLVEIEDIPDGNFENGEQWLEERVLTADAARKLVYFDVQARKGSDGSITLFDGSTSGGNDQGTQIVPVPVVPANPTQQPNVSPANLVSG
jgi:hypothetical protein